MQNDLWGIESTSNLGVQHFEGTIFLKKKGAFSKNKKGTSLLCLLQNLRGHVPSVASVHTSMNNLMFLGCNEAKLIILGCKKIWDDPHMYICYVPPPLGNSYTNLR